MIRPTHLIRRTTSCLADLTLNAVATLGCHLADRWEAYQAGAQAAIELTDDNLARVLADWSHA